MTAGKLMTQSVCCKSIGCKKSEPEQVVPCGETEQCGEPTPNEMIEKVGGPLEYRHAHWKIDSGACGNVCRTEKEEL